MEKEIENKIENKIFHTIRYMGNKEKLLSFIVPEIISCCKKNDIVCDLMSGTNIIGYVLRDRNIIYSNDIQYYSYVIANAILKNMKFNFNELKETIEIRKLENSSFNFIYENYKDTYFSGNQCNEIDNIRYAIETVEEDYKYVLLTALMMSMCKCQSTTGHFAQFLDKNHKRVIPLRKMSITDEFYKELIKFNNINGNNEKNKFFNLEVIELLKKIDIKSVGCFYLDPPYTHDQYSRFYHLLETVCKYDKPNLKYKAKYRMDRFMSDFCYSKNVIGAFSNIFEIISSYKKPVVVSYSNRGVLSIDELISLGKKFFKNAKYTECKYKHSSQGKGGINVSEKVLTLF